MIYLGGTFRRCVTQENAFDEWIRRWDTAEERISELEDWSIETSQNEKEREKKKEGNKQTEHPREGQGDDKRYNISIMGVPGEK